jgi:CRP-like cAMP-binding protein
VVILRLAHAGEVLGLNCVLYNSFYDTTVKTLAPCCIDFMSRAELIEFSEEESGWRKCLIEVVESRAHSTYRTYAVVTLTTNERPVGEFAARMQQRIPAN